MRRDITAVVHLDLDADAALDRNEIHKAVNEIIARLARSYRYRDVEVVGGHVQAFSEERPHAPA